MAVDRDACLNWNSYFILQKGGNPLTEYAGFDGLGSHNFCRCVVLYMLVFFQMDPTFFSFGFCPFRVARVVVSS